MARSEKTLGHFSMTERQADTSAFRPDSYDLVILVSSWESRCCEVLRLPELTSKSGILINFTKTDTSDDRSKNIEQLHQRLKTFCESTSFIQTDSSLNPPSVFPVIERTLLEEYLKAGRPLKVFFDISCCPKTYLLHFVALGFRSGMIKELHAFYSIGLYSKGSAGDIHAPSENIYRFTTGLWTSQQIPHLEGQFFPGRKRKAIVSLGFESPEAIKFLKRYEPEELELILPNPGFRSEYTHQSAKESDYIQGVDDALKISVANEAAPDVIRVIEGLFPRIEEELQSYEVIAMCLGPKTHALAFGILGILIPSLPIICRLPKSYARSQTQSSGMSVVYKIKDKTALV